MTSRRNHPRPWHKGSIFGDGARRTLDRNARARWRYLVHAHARAGRISPKGEWALAELEQHLSRDGRCDPSHERLAASARISQSTVERALADARALGLVTWQRRIARAGHRVEQTSNAYILEAGGEAPPRPPPPPIKPINLESCFTGAVTVAAKPAPLAEFLAAQESRLAAKFAAERAERRAAAARHQAHA